MRLLTIQEKRDKIIQDKTVEGFQRTVGLGPCTKKVKKALEVIQSKIQIEFQ